MKTPYDMLESNVWFTKFEECNKSLMSHFALSNTLYVNVYIYAWKASSIRRHTLIYENTLMSPLESEV